MNSSNTGGKKDDFKGNCGPPLSLMARLGVAIIILWLLCGHLEAYQKECLKQTSQGVQSLYVFTKSPKHFSYCRKEVTLYGEG